MTVHDWIVSEMDRMNNPRNWEMIVCPACHYDDGSIRPNQPKNIKTGFVLAGLRHQNCIATFGLISSQMPRQEQLKLKRTCVQGFITTKNRFVSREEAMHIAINAGQVLERNLHADHIGLFSEDLY